MFDVGSSLANALGLLASVDDIVTGRVDEDEPPPWCVRRGWSDFLLTLDPDALARSEADGLTRAVAVLSGVPADLRALTVAVTKAICLPALTLAPSPLSARSLRGVAGRKQQQLRALVSAVTPLARTADRIVDVGAGSGHFTRLAAEVFGCPAIGLERSATRVAAAQARATRGRFLEGVTLQFTVADTSHQGLVFAPGDLAVGLHACGDLGDQLIQATVVAGCDVALVSCCLQKISAPFRTPLSRTAAGWRIPQQALGLTNLTPRARGVETKIEETMQARETRYALRSLLRARGVAVEPGGEMHGLNRRRAHGDLHDLAARACRQRGLPAPSDAEIVDHETQGRDRFARVRRFSLPRNLLARLVEVAVVLDRARALEESGHHVHVAMFTDASVTPRNLAVFASREPGRLASFLSSLSCKSVLTMRLFPPLVVAATVASLLILPTTAALLRAIDVLWPAALRDSWGATPATWIALFWRLTLGGILAVLTWPLAYVAARYDLVRTFRTLEILVVAVALLVTVQGLLLP